MHDLVLNGCNCTLYRDNYYWCAEVNIKHVPQSEVVDGPFIKSEFEQQVETASGLTLNDYFDWTLFLSLHDAPQTFENMQEAVAKVTEYLETLTRRPAT
jgi:hypothetical protein